MFEPHSTYQYDPDQHVDIRVRQPVQGDPELTDLVHPGDYIRSSYGTEGLVVKVWPMQYDVGNRTVTAYSIQFWSRRKLEHLSTSDKVSLEDFSIYNEVVVHRGRLCKLLEPNPDTFEIVPVPADVIICDRARAFLGQAKPSGQLSLF